MNKNAKGLMKEMKCKQAKAEAAAKAAGERTALLQIEHTLLNNSLEEDASLAQMSQA